MSRKLIKKDKKIVISHSNNCEGVVLIRCIQALLSKDEVIKNTQSKIVISSESKTVNIHEYVESGKFVSPFDTSLERGLTYQAIIVRGDGKDPFNSGLDKIYKLGYQEAKLMDGLHIFALMNKSMQGYENNLGIRLIAFFSHLITSGTKSDFSKGISFCIPRLSLNDPMILDYVRCDRLHHHSRYGMVGIKEI